jgi:hypothetical protein
MDGAKVAVKASKFPGRLRGWTKECATMQKLHSKACAAGQHELKMMETYIPTCLEVIGTDDNPFLVMHATGTVEMQNFYRVVKTEEDSLSVFGQLVASIFSLHNVDLTHNDLHAKNIMLEDQGDETPHIHLALIDFGCVRGPEGYTVKGRPVSSYKRDAFSIWRTAGNLAGCEGAKQLGNTQATMEKTQLLECLKTKWGEKGADADFLATFETLIDDTLAGAWKQHVKELYNTAFVQGLLPPLKQHYKLLDPETCDGPGLLPSLKPGAARDNDDAPVTPKPSGQPRPQQESASHDTDLPIATLAENSDCAKLCRHCPKRDPMYACHSGRAIKQCNGNKNAWMAADCAGICDCNSPKD